MDGDVKEGLFEKGKFSFINKRKENFANDISRALRGGLVVCVFDDELREVVRGCANAVLLYGSRAGALLI